MCGGAQAVAKPPLALSRARAQLWPGLMGALNLRDQKESVFLKEQDSPWEWRNPLMRPK